MNDFYDDDEVIPEEKELNICKLCGEDALPWEEICSDCEFQKRIDEDENEYWVPEGNFWKIKR